jgi:hypothetical protein
MTGMMPAMKQPQTKPASLSAPASAFVHAQAKLEAKIISIRKELDGVIAEQRESEARGEHQDLKALTPAEKLREAAMQKLNGSAQGKAPKGRRGHPAIIARREVLEHTLLMANGLHSQLSVKIKAELGEARADEYREAMRQWALTLVAYERASQTVEKVCAGTDLQVFHLRGLGRLHDNNSALSKALEHCRRAGYLTKRDLDLDQEIAQARQAATWK